MTATADQTTLGERIRSARKDAGFKNAETFAVRLEVGARTVQRWETNEAEPTLKRLREIAAMTGKPLGFFLSGLADDEVAA